MVSFLKADRFDVFLINLDPTQGTEIKKTRPCIVISPNEINHNLSTIIIAPMTTKGRQYVTRVPLTFDGKDGKIILDQIRAVDRIRFVKKLGRIDKTTQKKVLAILQEMFAE